MVTWQSLIQCRKKKGIYLSQENSSKLFLLSNIIKDKVKKSTPMMGIPKKYTNTSHRVERCFVLFSYRTSVHATTKYTPFFLMYGREAVLPIQLHTSNVDNGHAIPEIESEAQRHAARLDTIRTETFMKVASNIENAQAKQKLYYDRKHAMAEFKLGSPVLRKLSRKGGKMTMSGQALLQ